MGYNFMEAGTEINSAIHTIENSQAKIANCIARAVAERAKQGKISTSTASDIDNLLKDLPVEQRYRILLTALVTVVANGSYGNGRNSSASSSVRKSIFD